MTTSDTLLLFRSPDLPPGALRVLRLRAREALSTLYGVSLILESTADLDTTEDPPHLPLGGRASVLFGPDEEHPFHGIVEEVRTRAVPSTGRLVHHVHLVPRMWLLTGTFRSRVFQDLSVPEIVAQVLSESGLSAPDAVAFRLAADHPKREYTVQYQETDFAFVSRLLEYEGMFYFFEQGEEGELLVVGDSNFAFGPTPKGDTLPFLPPGGARSSGETGLLSLGRRERLVEKKVRLLDYNYRSPGVALSAEAAVAGGVAGERAVYGEHFKTNEEGARLAALRAEERAALSHTYDGRADVRGFHAGCRFKLEDHEVAAFDQEYVLYEIRHAADAAGVDGAAPRGYRAKIRALPASVPFRPALSTPRPKIHAFLHARVDGAQKTSIDDQGRYKILLPFDAATPGTGQASRWIRMAQPSAGAAGKMHFPLEVGSEVVLAHIDGDPDRPIIAAAVPNPAAPSPVVAANAMQGVIRSRSGIRVIFDDNAGPEVGS